MGHFFNSKTAKMPRIKIVTAHFLISLTVVLSLYCLIISVWYPDYHSQDPEFKHIILIVFCVDITLGPLLTAIIFKPNKKLLKFDLSVIALLQIAALSYGLAAVFIARPAFTVFNVDRFNVVSYLDISEQELKKAVNIDQNNFYTQPKVIGARLPVSLKERQELMMSSALGGLDLAQLPQYYIPYSDVVDDIKSKLQSFDGLLERKPEYKQTIDKLLVELNIPINEIGFLPVVTSHKDVIAIINRKDAAIVKYLMINSW